jgi:hypothetical protein
VSLVDPNLIAYYHEFFLRTSLSLPLKCSAKNARSSCHGAMSRVSLSLLRLSPAPVGEIRLKYRHFRFYVEAMRQRFPTVYYNNKSNINQIKAFPSLRKSTLQFSFNAS